MFRMTRNTGRSVPGAGSIVRRVEGARKGGHGEPRSELQKPVPTRLLQGSAALRGVWLRRVPDGRRDAGRPGRAVSSRFAAPELPENAAPQDQQILRVMGREGRYLDWSKSVQQRQFESALITEPLVRRNENYELAPAGAESWEVSDD